MLSIGLRVQFITWKRQNKPRGSMKKILFRKNVEKKDARTVEDPGAEVIDVIVNGLENYMNFSI